MKVQILLNTIKNMTNDVTVECHPVQKGSEMLTGISIGNGNVRPTVYMEHFEDLFQEQGYTGVARKMIEICKNGMSQICDFDPKHITSWDYAKDNLMLCVAPRGTYELSIPYLDLELYFRVNITNSTYVVTENLRETWCVTEGDLLEISKQNQYMLAYITSRFIDLKTQVKFSDEMAGFDPSQYLGISVTNEAKCYGASAIYHKEILKFIANQYEDDVFIAPSSIHEIIVFPVSCMATKEYVDAMVREVNAFAVRPEERLAGHAYIFRRETGVIEF